MNGLTPRIALGSALLAAFVTIVFVALVGATNQARDADLHAHETAAAAQASIQRDVAAFAARHETRAAKQLEGEVGTVIAVSQADTATRSERLGSGLSRWVLLGIAGLIGALMGIALVGTGLSRLLARPVRALADAARRVGEGDLSARVPETGPADLRRLAHSMNSMAASLETTRNELAEKAAQLETSHEAMDANRAKSEFLSRMSHELRTPLNAILGFAQLLEVDDLDPRQRDNVAHIVSGGRHLLDLINEVLEISRLETGTLSPSIEPVHAATTLREAVELVSPLASQRRIELQMNLGPDADVWVEADQQRLKQVMLNLLANAVKYNREEGSVSVSFKRTDERLRILVTDTGQGIPQDQIHKLFTPFERLGAEASGVEGTGLGLVLALRLMEAMGGTIGVESQPWIGSTFHAELPITAPGVQPEEVRRPTLEHAMLNGHASTAHSVLYVEDDPANVRLMSKLFEEAPEIQLLTTMQGKLGIELARQHRPDLILLDLHLPDLEGNEVIRRLREDPITCSIPVIVVSADATEDTIKRMRLAGATHYLTKPLQLDVVLSTVRDALDNVRHAATSPRTAISEAA